MSTDSGAVLRGYMGEIERGVAERGRGTEEREEVFISGGGRMSRDLRSQVFVKTPS